MPKDKVIKRLNQLIRLDTETMRAYEAAIGQSRLAVIRHQLEKFKADHARHVGDLAGEVLALGGEPARRADLRGLVLLGANSLMSKTVWTSLVALRAAETLARRMYAKALKQALTVEQLAVLERNQS